MLQLRREREVAAAQGTGDEAAAEPEVRGRGRGRGGGGAAKTNAMAGFQADREKLEAKTDEWQLLFGGRAATQKVDEGDPEPVAAGGNDDADDDDDDSWMDGGASAAVDDDPPSAMHRPRRGKGPRKRYTEPGNDPEKDDKCPRF